MSTKPVVHDVSREAVDSLRGYSYQILRSIQVWIELADDEVLFLEGAEDLDRVRVGEAIVEQVKDTAGSGSITMRTRAVLDAVNHAWAHSKANPGVDVQFRYLTTSPIGRENGDPLRLGGPALAAWQSIRAQPGGAEATTTAQAIAAFLLEQESIDQELKNFLHAADSPAIIDQLVMRIDWITGAGDISALRSAIVSRLITIGAERGDTVHDSEQALGALHLEAWKRAVAKDRSPLTRADFLKVFEGATRTAVPNSQLVALMAVALGGGGGNDAFALQLSAGLVERVPPLPPRYFVRPALECEFASALTAGSVVVQGSTGTGKTSLVASVVANAPKVVWLSLRDAAPALLLSRLASAQNLIAMRAEPVCLILDDLNQGVDPRMIESALAQVSRTVTSVDGRIVITSARDLSPRLVSAIDQNASQILRMTRFERDEIAIYLAQQGCPQDLVATWAGLVEIATSGHPQLVHARVAALEASGFPRPSASDLLITPKDVVDVRAEARSLVALLPNEVRELLLRASLETGRLTRAYLIRIGLIVEPVTEPGTVIDQLVGPWLERADDGEFRVSPLVRDAAVQMRGTDWASAMHLKLAWAMLGDRSITATTLSTLITHCIVGGSAAPLTRVMPSLLSAKRKVWKQIGEVCGFFTAFGTGDTTGSIFPEPADVMIFRTIQFRIALVNKDGAAAEIISRANVEWNAAPHDSRNALFRFLFLSQVLMQEGSPLTISDIVSLGLEFAALGEAVNRNHADQIDERGDTAAETDAFEDFSSFMVMPLIKAVQSRDDFAVLLDHVAALSDEQGRLVLAAYGAEGVRAGLVTDKLWLTEIQRDAPDWSALRSVLERGMREADRLDVPVFKSTIAPLLVRMIDENMTAPDEAIVVGNALLSTVADDAQLSCAIAKVLWRKGDFVKALAIYDDALPRWKSGRENLDKLAAYRDAGIAAGRAGRWSLAASRFDTALSHVTPGSLVARRVGLIFDAGHALMMAGDADRALDWLAKGVGELEPLEPISETEPVLSMQKRAGALLQALIEVADDNFDADKLKLFAGLCSSLDPIEWDEMKPTPTDFIVYNLVQFEQKATTSVAVILRYAERLRRTPFTVLRAVVPSLLFKAMRVTGDYAQLIADGVAQTQAFAVGRAAQNNEADFKERFDETKPFRIFPGIFGMVSMHLVSSLFAMVANEKVDLPTISKWRGDVPGDADWQPLRMLVDEAHRLFTTDADFWPAVQKPLYEESEHLLAALAFVCRRNPGPDQSILCHGLWAHYLRQRPLHEWCEADVETLVTRRWGALCETPALLVMPRFSVPALGAALVDGAVGWTKVKAVLTAALQGVSSGAAGNVRSAIGAIETTVELAA